MQNIVSHGYRMVARTPHITRQKTPRQKGTSSCTIKEKRFCGFLCCFFVLFWFFCINPSRVLFTSYEPELDHVATLDYLLTKNID